MMTQRPLRFILLASSLSSYFLMNRPVRFNAGRFRLDLDFDFLGMDVARQGPDVGYILAPQGEGRDFLFAGRQRPLASLYSFCSFFLNRVFAIVNGLGGIQFFLGWLSTSWNRIHPWRCPGRPWHRESA